MTRKTLSKDGKVRFDFTYHQRERQRISGQIYNLLAYGMFLAVFSGFAAVNLAFNREDIRR